MKKLLFLFLVFASCTSEKAVNNHKIVDKKQILHDYSITQLNGRVPIEYSISNTEFIDNDSIYYYIITGSFITHQEEEYKFQFKTIAKQNAEKLRLGIIHYKDTLINN